MSKNQDDQAIFVGMLEKYLNVTLHEKFVQKQRFINRDTLKEIKNEIKEGFQKLFNKCHFVVSEKAVEFITDEYFMGVNINGMSLNQMLISNQMTPEDVPTEDLDTLINLFRDTTIGDKLEESRQKR